MALTKVSIETPDVSSFCSGVSSGSKKVSAGFMPVGPQLAATQMATIRWLLSVRFIRAEAMFFDAFTCFRWHEANGELETIGVSR